MGSYMYVKAAFYILPSIEKAQNKNVRIELWRQIIVLVNSESKFL